MSKTDKGDETMDVRDLIEEALTAGGFGGLFNAEIPCGCLIGDLAPCGDECLNISECQAGYKHDCDGCWKNDGRLNVSNECDVEGGGTQGGWCVALTKEFQPKKVEPELEDDPLFIRPEDTKVGDYITFRALGNRFGSGRVSFASVICGLDVTMSDGAIVACNWCDILSVQRPQFYEQQFHAEAMSDLLAAMDFAVIQREVEQERKP
jgi:hypothetical protein